MALEALPKAVLDKPLEMISSREPGEVISEMAKLGGPATHASGGGRYFGFVTGCVLSTTLAVNWLASTWDQNCWNSAMSPAGAIYEHVAVRDILSILSLPSTCSGVLCSGTTCGNIIALNAACDAVLPTQLPEIQNSRRGRGFGQGYSSWGERGSLSW